MERRTSLGGHLSLSTSNIASPLAESTHINGSSLQTKFPWGGKMSPAKSVISNNSVSVIQKSMPKVAVSPIRKIDPRIYTDVQSNGLTSRIVKYHENSSKLNRSLSVGNLYSKPGQFPVVHLKKTEMHVKPRRNPSISVVRIAPPDKTLYQANARSSILRTGSILPTIGLVKPQERESRDNRPILPPAENDVNPTRSVLDALKEISRKRINSENVDCNDSIKKYCKEMEEDPRRHLHLPLTNIATLSQQVSVITKRQREVPASPESKTSSPENNAAVKKRICTKNNDISSSLSSSLLINTPKRKLQDIQGRPPIGRHSPSSSNLAPPRAKQHCNDRNYVITGGSVTDGAYKYPPDQLTPIPPTPAVEPPLQEKPKPVPVERKPAPQKPKLTLFDKDYDTTPIVRRDNDEARQPEEEGIAGISFIKPKKSSPVLTGKNALIERVQTSKLSLMLSCLSGELNDSDDEVDSKTKEKPKETVTEPSAPVTTAVSSVFTNPTPTSTAPTTAAISSSSASSTTSSAPTTTSAPSFSFGLKSADAKTSTPAAPKTSESTGTSEASTTPTFSFGTSTATNKSDNPSNVTTIASSTPSLNFAAPTGKPTFGTNQQNNLNTSTTPSFAAPISASATSIASAPSGGFSFGLEKTASSNATSTATLSSSTTTSSLAPASAMNTFSFGAPKNIQSSGTTISAPNLTSATVSSAFTTSAPLALSSSTPTFGTVAASQSQTKPLFSFNAPATTSSTSTTVTTSSSAPNFSFGSAVSKPLPMFGSALSSSTTTTAAPSFTGQNTNIPTFGSASQPQTTSVFGSASSAFAPSGNAMKSPPKYGESGNTFGSANSGTNSSGGFSFGGSTQPGATVGVGLFGSTTSSAIATTTSSTPAFGFGSSVANKTTSAPSFNFSTPNANTTNAVAVFGAATTATTTAPSTQTPFAFGASTGNNNQVAPTQPTPFSFQGASQPQTQTASAGFNFSGNQTANPPAFGFGAAASTTAQPQTTKSFTFGGGSGTSAFTAVNSNKPASGGFSFNTSSAATTENKSIFGANATQPVKPFSFSGAADNKPNQPQSTPVFGSPTTANSAPAPTFGAPAMTPGKLFSFGGTPANNNAPAANAPSPNLFGTPATKNNTATPLFPAAANITQSPFGAATNATKPAAPVFNFTPGTNVATNNNAPAAGTGAFGFGTVASQPQNANKPFAFGSTAPTAQQTGNIFGSAAASKAPAFNFSGSVASGPADGMNNNNPLGAVSNPFSPMGGGDISNIQRREIRTATRRLKPK